MRILLFMLLACFSFAQVNAQNDDVKKEINKVKKSRSYIYAESTAPNESDAKKYAEEKLYNEINKWVAERKRGSQKSSVVVSNKKELWTTLSMPRGSNMHRAFIYVKKSDIVPTDNAVVIENPNASKVSEEIQIQLPEAIRELAKYTAYADLAKNIKMMKAAGKIKSYARYAALEHPERCYLFIYNREAKVVAVLTSGEERVNVKTNKKDGIKNYSGCGAIGIEI